MLLYAMINANCIHAAELERLFRERANQPNQWQNSNVNAQMNGQNAIQQGQNTLQGPLDHLAISALQSLGYA